MTTTSMAATPIEAPPNDFTSLADVLDHEIVNFVHTLVSGQNRPSDG